jgi:hypothetical protein
MVPPAADYPDSLLPGYVPDGANRAGVRIIAT